MGNIAGGIWSWLLPGHQYRDRADGDVKYLYFEVTFQKSAYSKRYRGISYVNSLWSSNARWRYRPGSTPAHVMACCLKAPSHYHDYLNQCWLIISEGNFARDILAMNHYNQLENYLSKISLKSPKGHWVKYRSIQIPGQFLGDTPNLTLSINSFDKIWFNRHKTNIT